MEKAFQISNKLDLKLNSSSQILNFLFEWFGWSTKVTAVNLVPSST